MKLLALTLLVPLIGCGSSRYAVGSGEATPKTATTPDQCDAHVTCLPNGNCLINCTNGAGQSCEMELSCNGDQCEVMRSNCSASQGCAGAGKPAQQ